MARFFASSLLGVAIIAVLAESWGYWYSQTHASIQIRIDDYGLKSEDQAYGVPHGVTLQLLDDSRVELAKALSIEPVGIILANHPDAHIGNCQHLNGRTSVGLVPHMDYAACYSLYSSWLASWAPRVRSADVQIGQCLVKSVPVQVHRSNSEWWLWWVPLPHIGGLPRQHFQFSVAVDSRACRLELRPELNR